MALSTNLRVNIGAKQTSTLDLGSAEGNIAKAVAINLASGTAAGQADRIFSDTRTLAASANEDLDLAGGGLTDAFGAALTFVKVKGMLIVAAAGNTNNVIVGGAASAQFLTWVGAGTPCVITDRCGRPCYRRSARSSRWPYRRSDRKADWG